MKKTKTMLRKGSFIILKVEEVDSLFFGHLISPSFENVAYIEDVRHSGEYAYLFF